MYLETIDEKAFRSFLSNPAISVLDGNVLDKYNGSNFYRFVRVPLSDGEHSVEALFGQMCSNYPTSMPVVSASIHLLNHAVFAIAQKR